MKFEAQIKKETMSIDIDEEHHLIKNGNGDQAYSLEVLNDGRYLLRLGLKTFTVDDIAIDQGMVHLSLNGQQYSVGIKDEQALLLESLGFAQQLSTAQNALKAPMPGKILEVLHQKGDKITKGEPLVILEAMKMENELTSPSDGEVDRVHVQPGDSVEKNATLIEIHTSG